MYIHNGEKIGRRVGSPVTDKALSLINEFKQTGCQNTEIYQKCRKAYAFRYGNIRHALFPRQLEYRLAVYSK